MSRCAATAHGVANLASTLQVGDRQNHAKSLSVHLSHCVKNVGTLLIILDGFTVKGYKEITQAISDGRIVNGEHERAHYNPLATICDC